MTNEFGESLMQLVRHFEKKHGRTPHHAQRRITISYSHKKNVFIAKFDWNYLDREKNEAGRIERVIFAKSGYYLPKNEIEKIHLEILNRIA